MAEAEPEIPDQPPSSGSTKIIFFVFVSTFLTALVVSWISIQSTHDHLRGQVDRSFPALLERHAGSIDRWLEEATTSLAEAPASPRRLTRWLEASPHFTAALAISSSGEPLFTAGSSEALEGVSFQYEESDGPRVGSALAPDGRALPIARAPLGGSKKGELLAFFDPGEIAAQLGVHGDPWSGELVLLDAQGRSLVVPSDAATAVPAAGPSELDLLLSQRDGTVQEYTGGSQERMLGSVKRLAGGSWLLLVEAPFAEVFEPILSVVTRIFVTDLVIILLFSYLAYRITAAMMRPIEALSVGARRITQGHLDVEIPDPRTNDEIGLLTRTFNDMMRKLRRNQLEIEAANDQLTEQNEELQRANEVLAQLSITDGLTKLHNHRHFQDHLTREIKRVSRTDEPLSILLADLDDFKRLNDQYGHAAGDELLLRVAKIMQTSIRESDLLARYGGEEFVVLAPNTDLEGAMNLAEKVRTAIAESSYIIDDSMRPVRVTISIGVATFTGSRKEFFQAADRALYRAKAEGKNCVVTAD